jgi:pantoate--beta-alanine ligase
MNSMYPSNYATSVSVSGLTEVMDGAPTSRGPGHFRGVTTVVTKLFNLVRPHRSYFGMKDFQQIRVLERMTEDLNFDMKIVRCPTIREKDGLAMSSRNAYLSPSERALAPQFHLALQQGRKLLRSPRRLKPSDVRRGIETHLKAHAGIRIEYVELVNPDTLQPVRDLKGPVLLAAAIRIGRTRLIDNLLVQN